MRRLFLIVPVVCAGLASPQSRAADAVPDPPPIQVSLKVETLRLAPKLLQPGQQLSNLAKVGVLSAAQVEKLRAQLSTAVSSGTVLVTNSFTVTTLSGVPARMTEGPTRRNPELVKSELTLLPVVTASGISTEFSYTPDALKVASQKGRLNVPDGGAFAIRSEAPNAGGNATVLLVSVRQGPQ